MAVPFLSLWGIPIQPERTMEIYGVEQLSEPALFIIIHDFFKKIYLFFVKNRI